MTRFFEKRDPWGHGMALWVLATMVFLLPPAWWMVRQFDWTVAAEDPLSKSDPAEKIQTWVQGEFPSGDRLLMSWKGNSLDDPRVRRLAIKLAGTRDADGVRHGGVPEVRSAVMPRTLIRQMIHNGVSRDEAVRRLSGTLIGSGVLKVRLTEAGRNHARQVKAMLSRKIRSELGLVVTIADHPSDADAADADAADADAADADDEDFSEDEEPVDEEPLLVDRPWDFQIAWPGIAFRRTQVGKVRELVSRFRMTTETPDKRSADQTIAECFLTPGSPVAIAVVLTDAGHAGGAETLRVLRQAAASVGIPPEELTLTGHRVADEQLSRAVSQVVWNPHYPITHFHKRSPILFAALVIVVLTLTLVRGLRTAALVLVSAGFATLLTMSLLPIIHGRMTMLLVTVPIVVALLTICGSVFIVRQWHVAADQNRMAAVAQAVEVSRRPCLLSAVIAAFAFFSLLLSPLGPVRDFGLYAGTGCLISLLVVLHVLPSLLQFLPVPAGHSDLPSPVDDPLMVASDGVNSRGVRRRATDLASRFRIPAMIGCLLLLAVGSSGWRFLRSDLSAARLFSPAARMLTDSTFQEDQLGGVLPVEMVVHFDTAACSQLSFLERMELVRRMEDDLRNHAAVSGAFSAADLQPVSAAPPSPKAGLLRKARYKKKSHAAEARLIGSDNRTVASLLSVARSSAELQIAPGHRIFVRRGDELWRITARVTRQFGDVPAGESRKVDQNAIVNDFNNIARSVLKTHPGADHVMTGPLLLQLREQQAVIDSLLLSFGVTAGAVTVLLMVLLGNPISGVLAMLPVLFPIATVLGILSWFSEPIGFGMLAAVVVAFGMIAGATLHVVIGFQTDLGGGLSRRDSLAEAFGRWVPSMGETGMIAGMGVLMLCAADLLIVRNFGLLTATLAAVALCADAVLLPALLAGPLGALIEEANRCRRRDAIEQEHHAAKVRRDRKNTGSVVGAPHWNSRPSSARSSHPVD